MKRVVLVLFVGTLASACASAQAKGPADRPTLEVPPPPPRTIEPMPQAESPGPEPVGELPPASPATPSRPRPNATREAPPRTESKPPEPPPAETTPPAAPPAPIPPAPQLRTPGSAEGPEAARQVRDMIEGARKALNSINYQKLNDAQRGQYNNAKLMLAQAEEQVKGSNFDIARKLAEKASSIATELPGR
jgi:hypothetical protein